MNELIDFGDVNRFCMGIFGPVLHVKRCRSLANGTMGVMHADKLGVTAIGQGLSRARALEPKVATKMIDRMLSNEGIDMEVVFPAWIAKVVAKRSEIVVAMDWTEFDRDGQHTITINLVTTHGRATPLVWKTVRADELKNRRGWYERQALAILRRAVPKDLRVTVLADRGFGDTHLFRFLKLIGFDYVIRFRGNVRVTTKEGWTDLVREHPHKRGEVLQLEGAQLTAKRYEVRSVVIAHDPGMKEPWYLATSRGDDARAIVGLYGRRFTIEESYRDDKDRHFGMGLLESVVGSPARRDRMLLIATLARVLLTLLGDAGEKLGFDRQLRNNTEDRRTHSLTRQGREYLRGVVTRMAGALRDGFRARVHAIDSNDAVFAAI